MKSMIAFCTDGLAFSENKILDETIAINYPGALWVARLAQFSKAQKVEVVTGDVAILRIQNGLCKPSDILVIQEESCSTGFKLIQLGAEGFLLICAESTLYARKFYAHLPEVSKCFKNRILFRGVFENTSKIGVNHVLYFPSFSQNSEVEIVAWSSRGFMVMVAANKYWKPGRSMIRHVLAGIRDIVVGRKSYITTETKELQLHDRRLELLEYFGQRQGFDLFGMHWGSLKNLPKDWRGRLQPVLKKLSPSICQDKHATISRYKFCICLENMSYPGYITEKIIDCFHAGVIPIYLGAPDVSEFIPRTSFIDLREYTDLDELHRYLKKITEVAALKIISAGRDFLSSKAGAEYSYEVFAKNVLHMMSRYE